MNNSILIGMPCQSGSVSTLMVQSLLQLHKPGPTAFMSVERQRVDKARNAIVMEFIKNGFDYLFFVDDDNPVPPDTLEKFIEDDKDVVIAPILSRNKNKDDKYALCAFYEKIVKTSAGKLRLYFNIDEFKEKGPLHKIDAGGTGCMLIKRDVVLELFKRHQDNIFEFGDIKFDKININGRSFDRRTMSEDAEFCERARDAGFEIWLDDRIRPFHITTYNLIQWQFTK